MESRYKGIDLNSLESDVYVHKDFGLMEGIGGDVIITPRNDCAVEYRHHDDDVEIIVDDEDEEGEEGDDDLELELVEVGVPDGFVRMRPSKFKFIPPSVFFEYPKELNMLRKDISSMEKMGRKSLNYSCQWGRNCIKNAFKRAGFNDSETNWTAMWSKHQAQSTIKNMNCLQKVNHFPASWCIGRKDRLMRTIHTMRRLHPDEFGFHPEGFILPSDSLNLERVLKADASRMKSKNDKAKYLWIMKPVASSCGKGIKVIAHDRAMELCKERKGKVLIQRYLADPYLINNKKFDLRMYVLVTGADPLRIYVHEEGLTRLSTKDYSLKNIKDRFAHLTNYSINKKASNFVAADEGDMAGGGGGGDDNGIFAGEREGFKWSLQAFKRWLAEQQSQAIMERTMVKIHDMIVKTIVAAEPDLSHSLHSSVNYRTNCFELFGFDVFLDSKLDPHLIEVNISPSLMGSSPLDRRIKGTVISDVCHIVGFQPYDNTLLSKYNKLNDKKSGKTSSAANKTSTSSSSSKKATIDFNPFSFTSLSKLMAGQDAWRRDMSVHKLNLKALESEDAAWYLMLMIEDEFSRGLSSKFQRLHPVPETLERYLNMYKNPRFSDHMIGKWTLGGLSDGRKNRKLIPQRFLRDSGEDSCEIQQRKAMDAAEKRALAELHSPRGSAVAVAKSRKNPGDTIVQRSSTCEDVIPLISEDLKECSHNDDILRERNEIVPSPITNAPPSHQQNVSKLYKPPPQQSRPKSAGRIRPKSGSNYHRANHSHADTKQIHETLANDTMQILDLNPSSRREVHQSVHDRPPSSPPSAFMLAQQQSQRERDKILVNKIISPRTNHLLSPGSSPRKSTRGSSAHGRSKSQPPRPSSPGNLKSSKAAANSDTSSSHKKSITRHRVTSAIASSSAHSVGDEKATMEHQMNQKYRPIGKREKRKVSKEDINNGSPLAREVVKQTNNTQITTANNIIHYRQQLNSVNVDIYQQLINRQADRRTQDKVDVSTAVKGRELAYSLTCPPAVDGVKVSPRRVVLSTTTSESHKVSTISNPVPSRKAVRTKGSSYQTLS